MPVHYCSLIYFIKSKSSLAANKFFLTEKCKANDYFIFQINLDNKIAA